ncbi:MAG: ATP-binding protein [Chitinophagaceae bacterium]
MIFIKRLILFVLAVALSSELSAQAAFRPFKVTHWDSRTGLPNDISLNLYQSREGFIWLSGYSGLIRFDGVEFATFNSRTDTAFKSDGITSVIYQTPDSALWVPTPGSGLIRIKNGKTQRFLTHLNNLSLLGVTDDGDLAIVVGPRIRSFHLLNYKTLDTAFISTRQSDSIIQIWKSKQSMTWVDPIGSVLLLGLTNIRFEQGSIEVRGDTMMKNGNSFLQDSKKRLWVGSDLGVFLWQNGKLTVPKGMENQAIIPAGFNRSIMLEDDHGGVWIGTRSGLAYLPQGHDKFTFYDGGGAMKLNNVQGMLKDTEGNIWVASDKGLFKFSESRFANYTEHDGFINSRINSIVETDSGKFLIATRDNGLYTFSADGIRTVSKDTQQFILSPKEIYYLFKDRSYDLWICSNGLIYYIGKGKKKKWTIDRQVRYATNGIDGKVYFAVAGKGVGSFGEGDSLHFMKFKSKVPYIGFLSSAKQRENGEWVITSYAGGIFIGKENEDLKNFPTIAGVGGVQVFSSYEDAENNIWFATAKGLAVLRNKADSLNVLEIKDGMPYSACFEVLEDQSGYFWLPTNLGVIKVSRAEILAYLKDPDKKINWAMLDEGDGLVNQQFVGARHPIIGSDKKLYFPNISGLVVMNPGEIEINSVKPKLAINGLSVDGKFFPADSGLAIPPGDHRYIISYSAMSFLAPEKTQIKFRLVGYDQDWIVSKGDRRAIYTNLPPGEHVFEMIAANNDGVWADAPQRFYFVVKPLFYQTPWFKLLGALALLGLIWLIVRWRTSATRQRNQELEAEVSKRTEQITKQKIELEQTVSTLKSTQKQLIQQEKMASLGELTAGIAHEIQNPLNFINNFSDLNKELIEEVKAEPDETERNKILDDIDANLDKVLFHGKRADSIVKSMLQHSHSKTGDKELTDINALADEYLRLSFHGLRAKDKNFQSDFSMNADPAVGQINIVRQDISRVLLNIINNAFYAVHDKAQKSGESYKPLVSVGTKKLANKVVITIEDNGDGIPENIIHKIFQPFFTTKPTGQGTGLGLSMSYDIVKSQGGDIQVSSEPGKGTTFTIQLPV